ncbi:helix-turn-helix domain-containing protein [Nocardia speluncae]|uniref:Helix-turn-helix domain-containing protein n=1 Tax=Nocardia speluncae TaxID=419477 RepID=A0A846XBG8_9NOCA|nr:helix-turn-helix transcriptional regulator [Nocardia speluncae]NKY33651.1 helix-turn-helix domain-containing protein [Nocardia speluncae]
MSIEPNPPTLPRRVLGRRLREMREMAGLTRAHAARRCEMGAQTLWRLETGRNSETKKMVINALCDTYEASADDRRELLWLVDESRKDGWWHSMTDAVVPEAQMYLGLEQAARKVFAWQTMIVPGLLQTPAYRRALWEIAEPLGRSIDIGSELALLQRRQERLQDASEFSVEFALSESVLRQPVGGPDVMTDQLGHLAEICALPQVSLKVVPFGAPGHLGLTAKHFVYLVFPDHVNPVLTEPPVVYVEGFTGALYLDKPSEITQYQAARSSILQVALDERDTQRLIEATAREYRS